MLDDLVGQTRARPARGVEPDGVAALPQAGDERRGRRLLSPGEGLDDGVSARSDDGDPHAPACGAVAGVSAGARPAR